MSFADKFTQLMQRPGDAPAGKEDVPWMLKYAGRGLGTVGSLIAILMGLLNCPGIILGQVYCFLGGVSLVLVAFIVICCEAPCCCMFIDHVQRLSEVVDNRPYWNRAAAYCGLSLIPFILCQAISLFFGCALIFGTGIIYGMMALGRKASAEEMRAAAAMEAAQSYKPPISMRDNLVTNAQPMATAPPVGFLPTPFDSNV
ncbi:calcium channel flower isoform X1 [Coccinella septempunctata]|uniref:calcium channel flower isoform X1 n=1 Tax=Coccinella septempunctata TaxID=41139 RepID=UPI001D0976A6|nr:calcium channel flower isoform X1 [Coccinella septempunctata]